MTRGGTGCQTQVRAITHAQLVAAVAALHFPPRKWPVLFREFTPYLSGLAMDVVGLRVNERIVRAVEVKSSRADWLRGLREGQLEMYARWCSYLTLAAPAGAVQVEELPVGIGLIGAWRDGRGRIQTETVVRATGHGPVAEEQWLRIMEGGTLKVARAVKAETGHGR